MPSPNWKKASLSQVAETVTVGYVGSMASQYVDSGIPFLRSQNILPYRVTLNDIKYIPSNFHKKIKKSALQTGDVVIVRTGKPGSCAVIPKELDGANCSDLVIVRPSKQVTPNFLCYYINSFAKQYIDAHLVGAVQQHFNVTSAKKMEIPVPPLKTQQTIAHILGTLDDKIDLNRCMNETLEAMARALFKSWFVDFDPVKAKMEGKQPVGMDAETAALFPDKLVESEFGMIPEGWKVLKLKDILTLSYGKALKKSDRIDGPYPVYGSGGVTGSHTKSLVDGPGIIVGRKGTVGSLYWENNSFFPIDTVFYVEPQKKIPLLFLYELLNTFNLRDMNTDAAVPGLNRNNVYRLELCCPPPEVVDKFQSQAQLLSQKRKNNSDQATTLTQLRNTLLPKLISGKLSVTKVEKQIQEL